MIELIALDLVTLPFFYFVGGTTNRPASNTVTGVKIGANSPGFNPIGPKDIAAITNKTIDQPKHLTMNRKDSLSIFKSNWCRAFCNQLTPFVPTLSKLY